MCLLCELSSTTTCSQFRLITAVHQPQRTLSGGSDEIKGMISLDGLAFALYRRRGRRVGSGAWSSASLQTRRKLHERSSSADFRLSEEDEEGQMMVQATTTLVLRNYTRQNERPHASMQVCLVQPASLCRCASFTLLCFAERSRASKCLSTC